MACPQWSPGRRAPCPDARRSAIRFSARTFRLSSLFWKHSDRNAALGIVAKGPDFHASPNKRHQKRMPSMLRAVETDMDCNFALSEADATYYRKVSSEPYHLLPLDQAPTDFFQLLEVSSDADGAAIKSAYRKLQRIVHPDIAGELATETAMLLNVAYDLLSDDATRAFYKGEVEKHRYSTLSFTGKPRSRWSGSESQSTAIFVDETACIGCRYCTSCAGNTFMMEEDYGRARVYNQWGNDAQDVAVAVDLCPVDAIYYVPREQLAVLEFVMVHCKREDSAIMARRRSGNMGPPPGSEDPFVRAEAFVRAAKLKPQDLPENVATLSTMPPVEAVASAIAGAWLKLPDDLKLRGWPSFHAEREAFSSY